MFLKSVKSLYFVSHYTSFRQRRLCCLRTENYLYFELSQFNSPFYFKFVRRYFISPVSSAPSSWSHFLPCCPPRNTSPFCSHIFNTTIGKYIGGKRNPSEHPLMFYMDFPMRYCNQTTFYHRKFHRFRIWWNFDHFNFETLFQIAVQIASVEVAPVRNRNLVWRSE